MSIGPGHIAKRERLLRADAKIAQPLGRYLRTMFFRKGERRGILAVYEGRMEFEVFTDPLFSQHVDWKDPDCKCLDGLASPCTILHVISELNAAGFELYKDIPES